MIIIFYITALLSGNDVGTTLYPFLKIGLGPRPVAMGETFTGLCDDVSALSWNPAGLAWINELQFSLSHQEWFLDFRDEYVIFGLPAFNGYLAMGGLYSTVRDVEIWDDNNNPLGSADLWSGILALGYGRKLRENLGAGIGLKIVAEDLYEQSFYDLVLDCGVRLRLNEKWSLGGAVRDLSYKSTLPSDVKLGICFSGIKNANLLLDLTMPRDNVLRINTGAEYYINPVFCIRGGWRSGPYSLGELGWLSGFTTGFGIKYAGMEFSYAFVPYGKLGLTHRIGLNGNLSVIEGQNRLTIRVCDGDTKVPLVADMILTGIREEQIKTNPTSIYEAKNLPEGWLYISIFVAGYPQNYDSLYILPAGRHEKYIYLYQTKPGILRGVVFDAVTKKPIGAKVVYQGMAYGTVNNDSLTGSFVLRNLPPGVYTLIAAGTDPRYIAQTCSLVIEPGKLTEREFYLIKKREKIVLRGVNFDTGKADLKPEAFSVLDEAGKILTDNPDISVEVGGHTDPREIQTTEYPSNWELSFARAAAVCKYLIDKFNVGPERLVARGYADTQPIAPNITEEGMAQNRRTEFKVIE
ncbi:MAG TPA: PorV/PorQ family protein [bacterium]